MHKYMSAEFSPKRQKITQMIENNSNEKTNTSSESQIKFTDKNAVVEFNSTPNYTEKQIIFSNGSEEGSKKLTITFISKSTIENENTETKEKEETKREIKKEKINKKLNKEEKIKLKNQIKLEKIRRKEEKKERLIKKREENKKIKNIIKEIKNKIKKEQIIKNKEKKIKEKNTKIKEKNKVIKEENTKIKEEVQEKINEEKAIQEEKIKKEKEIKERFDLQIQENLIMIKEYLDYNGITNIYGAESVIHGIGIFAKERISKGDLILEYVGEIIGKKVADKREKFYQKNNIISIYLFKIKEDLIIDATLRGNLARFLNHSCVPNAFTKTVGNKILIYALKDIYEDEEITFFYNFSSDDNNTNIPCHCGHEYCTKYIV